MSGSIHCPNHGNTESVCALCAALDDNDLAKEAIRQLAEYTSYTAEREAGFHAEITKLRAEIAALRTRAEPTERTPRRGHAP